jgi:uncharacterized membrane protein
VYQAVTSLPVATSFSGYLIPAMLALLSAIYLADRQTGKRETRAQNEALATLNTTTAILLAQVPTMTLQLEHLDGKVQTLEITTAVLKDALSKHERWHERQPKRLGSP